MKPMAAKKASWLSIGQASAYLGVSRDTLRRWEKKGKIKAVRSPSNRRYYTKKQLDGVLSGDNKQDASTPTTKATSISLKKKELILLAGFVLLLTLITVVVSVYLFPN